MYMIVQLLTNAHYINLVQSRDYASLLHFHHEQLHENVTHL